MNSIRVWLKNYLAWIAGPVLTIKFTNVLEILILAFLVYNVLLWIKNTKAWSLLKGIIILVL
ncbi:MAG: TIGR00159 family protein, partial [Candidatus Choladocola sp.]|nr:TIGR00159 family protein [Candidatus Choladocola sp.]